MTSNALSMLEAEVARFRAWAEAFPDDDRYGEWETEYDDWWELRSAFAAFVAATSCYDWSDDTIQMLLYAIARDNEMEELADEMANHPEKLMFLAERALELEQLEPVRQLFRVLSYLNPPPQGAEALLLRFARYPDEYVRYWILDALGRMGSSHVEELAAESWDSGIEHLRINALCALEHVGSPLLREYAAREESLSTPGLAKYALHIRETGTLSDFRIQGIPIQGIPVIY